MNEEEKKFVSPTYGQLSFAEVVFRMGKYMHDEPTYKYRVIVGTDSQENGKPAHVAHGKSFDFVTAAIIHRIGAGGIYFWQRERVARPYSLKERMYEEATRSMVLAQNLMERFEKEGFFGFDLEIHVDIGRVGETREVVNEVVGMIRGSGFAVKVKPEAYGASKVADRHV
ncbi:MAG: ribonuclease H-like YkuK family protein [Candidatus Cloacimonetes bacterium]|nr:ribonuclease H-like YkuK family protein [Candidatus Cloacimonadota bacterium]